MSEQAVVVEPGAAPSAAAVALGGERGVSELGANRDWLPEAYRAEPAFANFKGVDDLAKSFQETQKMARDRLPRPGDTPESMQAFYAAIRPEKAEAYEIPVPDGSDTEFADGFRKIAHEQALLPAQVKALAEWNNSFIAGKMAAMETADLQGLDAFKSDYVSKGGNWDTQVSKVGAMLDGMGVDQAIVQEFNAKLGSPALMQFLFGMVERVGPADVSTGDGQLITTLGFHSMSPDEAREKARQKMVDPEWRAKAQQAGTRESNEYRGLVARAAKRK